MSPLARLDSMTGAVMKWRLMKSSGLRTDHSHKGFVLVT